MRTEDGSVIYECLNGDPEAFGILVDKYKASIYAYVYNRLRDFQDAEDVTQEVFLQAYRNLRSLRHWESFAFWLHRMARNISYKWMRGKSRRPDSAFIESQHPKVLEKSSLDAYREHQTYRSLHESLQEAMDSLSETYREVLILHYFGGMTIKDMARGLGVSPAAIEKRLSRARAQLKKEMVAMIDTAFEEQKLQAGFTFRIVEILKRIRIHPTPRTAGLPWGLSIGTGIIITVLSMGSHLDLPDLMEAPMSSELPGEMAAMEAGEMPVDVLRMSRTPVSFSKQGNSYSGGFQIPDQQNAIFMAPRGEGGEFPEEPSARLGKGTAESIVYSPDGKILTIAGALGIRLYDTNNLAETALCQKSHATISPSALMGRHWQQAAGNMLSIYGMLTNRHE